MMRAAPQPVAMKWPALQPARELEHGRTWP
jgi:hypothetical protein